MRLEPTWSLHLNPRGTPCHSLPSVQLITIINLTQVTLCIFLISVTPGYPKKLFEPYICDQFLALIETEYGILQAAVR